MLLSLLSCIFFADLKRAVSRLKRSTVMTLWEQEELLMDIVTVLLATTRMRESKYTTNLLRPVLDHLTEYLSYLLGTQRLSRFADTDGEAFCFENFGNCVLPLMNQ
jgi:hypothetical protein